MHPEYTSNQPLPDDLGGAELALVDSFPSDLTTGQVSWAIQTLRTKCQGNPDGFRQEYPSDPDTCFLLSGRRFFAQIFQADLSSIPGPDLLVIEAPKLFRRYAVGIDCASGSPTGDFSAMVILDVSGPKPILVCRYAARLSPNQFAKEAAEVLRNYSPRLVMVESNADGISVAENLNRHGINVLRGDNGRPFWSTTAQSRPRLLSDLHEALHRGTLEGVEGDPRLCAELNSFAYNDKGKPEAQSGKHDDLVIALGLAVQAIPLVPPAAIPNDNALASDDRLLLRKDMEDWRKSQLPQRQGARTTLPRSFRGI
jgi:hypothetical protein